LCITVLLMLYILFPCFCLHYVRHFVKNDLIILHFFSKIDIVTINKNYIFLKLYDLEINYHDGVKSLQWDI